MAENVIPTMAELLSDAVAVVTGGSSGVGREIALQFASHGADVVIADIQSDPRTGGTPTHEKINTETDQQADYVESDVTDKSSLESAVDVAETFGPLSVMVNNAGMFRSEDVLTLSESDYDQLMDLNVKGVFFGSQVAGERMRSTGTEGCIINLSSVAGLQGSGEHASYCTAKGGVRLFTYALADALGSDGIRVNALHPGFVETAMTTEDVPVVGTDSEQQYNALVPLGRLAQPEDVANCAVFLASELASYVTGESLLVDGGLINCG